jgi:hypothetical protein
MKAAVLILAATSALGLAACQTTPTAFAPAATPQGQGYSDIRIEQTRYRVTYRGTDRPGAPAQDLALLHAADIALAQGYDWFRVVNRYDEARPSNSPTISLGTGGMNFGRRSAVGVGVGTSFQLDNGIGPVRTVTLEVQLQKGPTPKERDAYDAADVARSIRPRV